MFWHWADLDIFFVCKRLGGTVKRNGRGGYGITQGDGGVVSHWLWHHNKISDGQPRAEGQGLRFSPLYLSSFFFPPSSTVCLRVNEAFTCRQGEICQTRTKAPAWKGRKQSRNTYRRGWKEGFPNKSLAAHAVYQRVAPVPSQRCPNSGWCRCTRWHRSKGKRVWANSDVC